MQLLSCCSRHSVMKVLHNHTSHKISFQCEYSVFLILSKLLQWIIIIICRSVFLISRLNVVFCTDRGWCVAAASKQDIQRCFHGCLRSTGRVFKCPPPVVHQARRTHLQKEKKSCCLRRYIGEFNTRCVHRHGCRSVKFGRVSICWHVG